MEKLYSVKTSLFFFIFLLSSICIAQENFIVFKVDGTPILKHNDTLRSISKGSLLNNNSRVTLKNSDSFLMIDKAGSLYNVDKTGDYAYADLQKIPADVDDTSFTKKYFTYVWKQFTNNTNTRSKGGVVYRVDNNSLMFQPTDSVKIYFPEVRFVWKKGKEKDKTYYFILKDLKTNSITKIGTTDNNVTLFVDNNILKRDNSYEWTVSETKYPNLDKVPFYNFELINTEEFKKLQAEINNITTDLQKLGFTPEEIKVMLCEDYRICY